MGNIRRVTMPLLSTLAALVIIVHSAEEDLEGDYRYDLRPRALDTGTPVYDQLWRALEAEPTVQKSTQADLWHDSHEDSPKRRRPVRKRKRRPLPTLEEEPDREIDIPKERHHLDDQQSYEEYNTHTTEAPRRRRKKTESRHNRWTEQYLETGRPLRRRGQRRKRPSLENWPQLSEFNDYRANEEPVVEEQSEPLSIEGLVNVYADRYMNDNNSPHGENGTRLENNEGEPKLDVPQPETTSEVDLPYLQATLEAQDENTTLQEDKSLSEFSFENMSHTPEPKPFAEITDTQNQIQRNYPAFFEFQRAKDQQKKSLYDFFSRISELKTSNKQIRQTVEQVKAKEKLYNELEMDDFISAKPPDKDESTKCGDKIEHFTSQLQESSSLFMEEELLTDNGPVDPITLKEILKRSNGTSLSEILQLHNLSLADLLNRRENVVSVLKSDDAGKDPEIYGIKHEQVQEKNEENIKETKLETVPLTEIVDNSKPVDNIHQDMTTTEKGDDLVTLTTKQDRELQNVTSTSKVLPKRRFLGGARRKLRMKPTVNSTFIKGQLNRDLMALTARKYYHHSSRNNSKSKEWKNIIPAMLHINETNDDVIIKVSDASSTTISPLEVTTTTTTPDNVEYYNSSIVSVDAQTDAPKQIDIENVDTGTTQSVLTPIETMATEILVNSTEKPNISRLRPGISLIGLRRQAFTNRLKKKRLKQKSSTTESPIEQDDFMKDLFGMPNLVSSSEFIARTQTPKSTNALDRDEDITALDDFMTTESSRKPNEDEATSSRLSTDIPSTTPITSTVTSSTEETAKIEIEEILNDTRTSAKLSRILMERNMTLNELLEHRERGSSHVHLADIFHNASKEPNPPEPFLSKSSIEPISKETYPLRALLENNVHDPTIKATTIDQNLKQTQFVNIPVVMDFGNNVNENGENMGIMSLFNKYTGNDISIEKSIIKKDSEGTPYVTTVESVNTTNSSDTIRESRVLKDDEDTAKQDIVGWTELLSLMRRQNISKTEDIPELFTKGLSPPELHKQIKLDQDRDGDGLIVLEDLQHLQDFDSNIASASDEKLEVNAYERAEASTHTPGFLDKMPNHSRSVTVATASIVGLAIILFLLTYAAFKWKTQRRILSKKHSFTDHRIPSPVFENRKGHKNNCSTRSISPMLASSNIYTLNTLDSHHGKETPDYMWDSLRKPFQ